MLQQKITQFLIYSKKHILVISLILGTTLFFGMGVTFAVIATQSSLNFSYVREGHSVDQPFSLRLGSSVASIDAIAITPKVQGEWLRQTDIFGIIGVEFSPKQTFQPGTEYTIQLSGITRHATGTTSDEKITFTTEEAPGVLSFSVPIKKTTIAADFQPRAVLKLDDSGLRDVTIETEPEVKFERKQTDDGYMWMPKATLPQGQELIIKLKNGSQVLLERNVVVAAQPELITSIQKEGVTPETSLDLVFSEAIDIQKSPKSVIQFSIPGKGIWKNATTYNFIPEKLEPGSTYTYSIAKDMRTKAGGILENNLEATFATRGAVAVTSITPSGQELQQAQQTVQVTFDQPVEKKLAEQQLTVSSGTIQAISWEGNTLKATVAQLGYQTTVTVSVRPGIKPADFGLESAAPYTHSFTTETRAVRLNIPYYRQEFAQSCEAASLRMALAYRGVQDSDWNILQRFGYNPRSRDKEQNTWDDPTQQFVGDVRGDQGKGTGWGVYAGPVARAAGSYGRGTTISYGADASFVARQIHAGNPVIVWGIWGAAARIESWQTSTGQIISGPIPMHVRLIVGVKGEPSNPVGFYVNDPISGQLYWTRQQFVANTSAAGPAAQLLAVH